MNIDVVAMGDISSSAIFNSAITKAAELLNGSQSVFHFHVQSNALELPETDITLSNDRGPAHSFDSLSTVLQQEKERLGVEVLVGVTSERLEKNLFSKADRQKRVGVISTADWSEITELQLDIYLARAMARVPVWNLVDGCTHQDTRGCMGDYCYNKPDILKGIKSGEVCPECTDLLSKQLKSEEYNAVISMLKAIRDRAAGA